MNYQKFSSLCRSLRQIFKLIFIFIKQRPATMLNVSPPRAYKTFPRFNKIQPWFNQLRLDSHSFPSFFPWFYLVIRTSRNGSGSPGQNSTLLFAFWHWLLCFSDKETSNFCKVKRKLELNNCFPQLCWTVSISYFKGY